MTTSTITARRKGDPQHYVEGTNNIMYLLIDLYRFVSSIWFFAAINVCGDNSDYMACEAWEARWLAAGAKREAVRVILHRIWIAERAHPPPLPSPVLIKGN